MILTVTERGEFAATMRAINVRLMETLAAWVPTTPEMEVKLLFGEHIWDLAQHADALGKRTFELRMPLQHSIPPVPGYTALLSDVAALDVTGERVSAIYEVILPGLAARYRAYLDETDTLLDAPTVRILERCLIDLNRMIDQSVGLRDELPKLQVKRGWAFRLRSREAAIDDVVPDGAVALAGV